MPGLLCILVILAEAFALGVFLGVEPRPSNFLRASSVSASTGSAAEVAAKYEVPPALGGVPTDAMLFVDAEPRRN